MKKKTKVIIGVVAAVVVLGALGQGGSQNNSNKQEAPAADVSVTEKSEPDNILMTSRLKTADVMNGLGGTVIGTRAYVEISKDELVSLTQEQFKQFVDEVVRDSGYNYVSIIAEDATKAILFPGSLPEVAEYGKVNIDGTLDTVYGDIVLQEDGTYSYTER